jgi:hypothetical protein
MEPHLFTYNKDVDIEILSHVDDMILEDLCITDKYANKLCNNNTLWLLKIINKYPDFPLSHVNATLYKTLYYRLIHEDWTSIMIWTTTNNNIPGINWLINYSKYTEFVGVKINKYLTTLGNIDDIYQRFNLNTFFDFIYNHRYFIFFSSPLKNSIRQMLTRLQVLTAYSDYATIYLKLLFND